MSMDVFDLYAKIGLDTSEYDKGLATAGSKLQGLGNSIESKVGAAVKGVGVALAGATAAVGAFTASAVQTGLSFDASMSKVAAISGAAGQDLQDLTDKAEQMGATTKFSATEAADAMGYMAMAGWKTKDMLSGIEGIMNLAAASGEDLATTSDIVTDALTAFGLSAGDATHFADVLAAASNNANTNVAMMGETFKYAAPVAGALSYSIEDVATAIGLMANAGIKSSMAGTALRGLFTRMAKQPKEAAAAMNALNLSLEDDEHNMKSLREVMDDLRNAFRSDLKLSSDELSSSLEELDTALSNGEITSKEYEKQVEALTKRAFGAEGALKAQYAAMIAGTNGMSGLLAIVNTSDEDYEKLTAAIDNCNGAAKDMEKIMGDNLQGQIIKLQSAFGALQLSISKKVTPIITEFVKLGTDSLGGLAEAVKKDGLHGFIDGVVKILTVDLPNAVKQKLAEGGHDILYSLFSTASGGFNRFVEGFGKAFGNLSGKLKEFISSEKFSKFLARLQEISEKMTADRIATLLTGIGEGLLKIVEALVDFVNSDKVMAFFDGIAAWIDKKGVDGIADTLVGIADGLFKIWAASKVTGVIMSIGNAFLFLGGAIRDLKELKGIATILKGLGGAGGASAAGGAAGGGIMAGLASSLAAVPTLLASDVSLMGAATATEIGLTIGAAIAGGIAAAIAGYNGGKWGAWLVATIAGDTKNADLYKNFNLKEGVASLINPDENAADNVKDMFDGIVLMASDFENNPVIASLTNTLVGPLGAAELAIADFIQNGGFAKLKENASKAGEGASELWEDIKGGAALAFADAGKLVEAGLKDIEGLVKIYGTLIAIPWQFLWENMGKDIADAFALWGQDVYDGFLALADYENEIVGPMLEKLSQDFNSAFETIKGAFDLWGEDIYNGFLALGEYQDEIITPFLNNLEEGFTNTIEVVTGAFKLWGEDIHEGFLALAGYQDELIEPFLKWFEEGWNSLLEDTKGGFKLWGEEIYEGFLALSQEYDDLWDSLKKTFKSFLEWLEENFKLPHFKFEGELDLKNGKVPEIKVDWYAKAMDNAMILNGATIFGASGGRFLGGGEAGSEVVSGTGTLMNMIRSAVGESGSRNLTVILELDKTQLGKVVYTLNNEETQRVGVRLANV